MNNARSQKGPAARDFWQIEQQLLPPNHSHCHATATDDMTEVDHPDASLLVFLKRVLPTASAYTSLDTITQGNAEGNLVVVQHLTTTKLANEHQSVHGAEDTATLTSTSFTELFVKRIDATIYSHKSWPDLRRTLLYARTETRFYNEILPIMHSKGFLDSFQLAPKYHYAECNLDGLIPEDEHVLDTSPEAPLGYDKNGGKNDNKDNSKGMLQQNGATLVLEPLSSNTYFQDSPLTLLQASHCLGAVAKLHACAWEELEILELSNERLSKTSYHLPMRHPKELAGLEDSWNKFTSAFGDAAPDTFGKPNIKNLARRIKNIAQVVSNELSPQPDGKYVTLVHGDYKSMNVFLPLDEKKHDAVMIDFASIGTGYGMCDVAMHITHAVHPDFLKNGGEETLVDGYLADLQKAHAEKRTNSKSLSYPRDVALRHYRLAVIDYFRFILGRFWKSATPESFEQYRESKNRVLVNRNFEAAMSFIERVDQYLEEFEAEQSPQL